MPPDNLGGNVQPKPRAGCNGLGYGRAVTQFEESLTRVSRNPDAMIADTQHCGHPQFEYVAKAMPQ